MKLAKVAEFLKAGKWKNISLLDTQDTGLEFGKEISKLTGSRVTMNEYGPFNDLIIVVPPVLALDYSKIGKETGVIFVELEA
jgi:hypothetical protein